MAFAIKFMSESYLGSCQTPFLAKLVIALFCFLEHVLIHIQEVVIYSCSVVILFLILPKKTEAFKNGIFFFFFFFLCCQDFPYPKSISDRAGSFWGFFLGLARFSLCHPFRYVYFSLGICYLQIHFVVDERELFKNRIYVCPHIQIVSNLVFSWVLSSFLWVLNFFCFITYPFGLIYIYIYIYILFVTIFYSNIVLFLLHPFFWFVFVHSPPTGC